MKSEVSGLRGEISTQEKFIGDLNHDIKVMDSLSVESQRALGLCQNELSNVTEELAKIYHHICTANNITPSRIMLEHSKGINKFIKPPRLLSIYLVWFLYFPSLSGSQRG